MEGNITKEGIRADLEGMKEAGIGGLLFMDGRLTNPSGPERFMSDSWIDLFAFMVEEAGRLGLEINLNNDPGWAGSGGPWITPALATRRVIFAEKCDRRRRSGSLESPQAFRNSAQSLQGYCSSCLSAGEHRSPQLPHTQFWFDQILRGL